MERAYKTRDEVARMVLEHLKTNLRRVKDVFTQFDSDSSGWLSSDAVSASGGGRNAAGLASPAPGRPAPHGGWSGAPDALQQVVVPVAAP